MSKTSKKIRQVANTTFDGFFIGASYAAIGSVAIVFPATIFSIVTSENAGKYILYSAVAGGTAAGTVGLIGESFYSDTTYIDA